MKLALDLQDYLTGCRRYMYAGRNRIDRGDYPVDLLFTLENCQEYYSPRDAEGLPQRRYRNIGVRYNPTRIAAYGLSSYSRYLKLGAKEDLQTFLQTADWFCSREKGLYFYDFDWAGVKAPWISCMSQGEALSVLSRAYLVTKDARYLDACSRAVVPLMSPLEAGGVVSKLPSGDPFLEEYPGEASQAKHVLNGFLYALIGLSDFSSVAPDHPGTAHLKQYLQSLGRNLYYWNGGGWSIYDLQYLYGARENYATPAYHNLHAAQLRHLGERSGERYLKAMAEIWLQSSHSIYRRCRALQKKVAYRYHMSSKQKQAAAQGG